MITKFSEPRARAGSHYTKFRAVQTKPPRFKRNRRGSIFYLALIPALFLIASCCFAVPGRSQVFAAPSTSIKINKSRIDIKSDSLQVNNKTGVATFTGNVVAVKGNLTIFSNVLEVIYTKKNKINVLKAIGNVHIIKGKENITGGRAVYYNNTSVAVITENPVAYEGKNMIKGEKIIINLKTNVSTVFGAPGKRVNATVYSNKSLSLKPSGGRKPAKQ